MKKRTANVIRRDDWTEDEAPELQGAAVLDDEVSVEADEDLGPELPEDAEAAVLADDEIDDSDYDDGSDEEIDDEGAMALLDALDLDWDAPTDAHPGLDISLVMGGDDAQDDDLAA